MPIALGLLFVLGLVIGSFASVLITRLPKAQPWINTRSACRHCHHTLVAADLVPLVSFALLQGKCRYCREDIGWLYPLVEISMASLFVASGYWLWPLLRTSTIIGLVTFIWLLVMIVIAIVLAFIDAKHYILPDKLIVVGLYATIIYTVSTIALRLYDLYHGLSADTSGFGQALLISGFFKNRLNSEIAIIAWNVMGALIVALFFYLLILITKGKGMGIGDVKLAFLIGIVVGWPKVLVALFTSFVLGALVAVFLILLRKRTMKQVIPFGPFLLIGAGASFIAGDALLRLLGH